MSNPVIEIVSPDKRKSGRWKRSNKSKNRDGSGQPACVNIEIRKVVHFEKVCERYDSKIEIDESKSIDVSYHLLLSVSVMCHTPFYTVCLFVSAIFFH